MKAAPNNGSSTAAPVVPIVNDFRLSVVSGDPVPMADQTAKTAVYMTPYKGNRITLRPDNGSGPWTVYETAELTFPLAGVGGAESQYDVSCQVNGITGLPALYLVAWPGINTPPASRIVIDGVLTNNGDPVIGSIRLTALGQTEDSENKRFVWNATNQAPRSLIKIETTNSWTYTTDTFRSANNSTANSVQFLCGLAEKPVHARVDALAGNSAVNAGAAVGIGVDSTTVNGAKVFVGFVTTLADILQAEYRGIPGVGYHYLQWLEKSAAGSGTTTWYGDNGATAIQSGITGEVWA